MTRCHPFIVHQPNEALSRVCEASRMSSFQTPKPPTPPNQACVPDIAGLALTGPQVINLLHRSSIVDVYTEVTSFIFSKPTRSERLKEE